MIATFACLTPELLGDPKWAQNRQRTHQQRRMNRLDEKSLVLIGNASGRVVAGDRFAPLLPRGIFDKETRRKAAAVAGAAMELSTRIGLHGSAEEARELGQDETVMEIDLSGTSDFVNCLHSGIGYKFATSH